MYLTWSFIFSLQDGMHLSKICKLVQLVSRDKKCWTQSLSWHSLKHCQKQKESVCSMWSTSQPIFMPSANRSMLECGFLSFGILIDRCSSKGAFAPLWEWTYLIASLPMETASLIPLKLSAGEAHTVCEAEKYLQENMSKTEVCKVR